MKTKSIEALYKHALDVDFRNSAHRGLEDGAAKDDRDNAVKMIRALADAKRHINENT